MPGWSHPSRPWVRIPGSAGWVEDLDPVCRAMSLAEGLLRGGHSPAAGHSFFIRPHAGGMGNHHVSVFGVLFRPSRSLAGKSLSAHISANRHHLRPFQEVSCFPSEGPFHAGIGTGCDTPCLLSACLDSLSAPVTSITRGTTTELMDPTRQQGTAAVTAAAAAGPSLHDQAAVNSAEARASTERRHWLCQLTLLT